MSRAETAHRLTVSAVDRRVEDWTAQVARLQTMEQQVAAEMTALTERKSGTAEEMAQALMPIAEAMARLTEETRQTLVRVVAQSQKGHVQAVQSVRAAATAANAATTEMRAGMLRAGAVVDRIEALAVAERERPQASVWRPALVASLVPTAAIVALAWKAGFLSH